jgi:hypothetical protein
MPPFFKGGKWRHETKSVTKWGDLSASTLVSGFVTGIFLFIGAMLLLFAGLGKGLFTEVAPIFYLIAFIPNGVFFTYR